MRNSTALLLASVLLSAGCERAGPSAELEAEWEQRTRAHMDRYDRQLDRADDVQVRMNEQNLRFERLLDRWEEQARRYDAILDAMEKQQGIGK